jgi:hypothetical protein
VLRVLADARSLLLQLESSAADESSSKMASAGSAWPPAKVAGGASSSRPVAAARPPGPGSGNSVGGSGGGGDGGGGSPANPSSTAGPRHGQLPAASSPLAASADGFDAIVRDLQAQCTALETEASHLLAQETKVLEKRSLLNSTLLAQRNHLLMKNAPDAEVEALNQRLSGVMAQIANAMQQIESNKRSVTTKLELARLQLSVAQQRSAGAKRKK